MRWACATLLGVLTWGGCAGPAVSHREPPNLDLRKQAIRAYVESGEYLRQISQVAASASAWLNERVARRSPGERLAVVMDLDETLFYNWPHIMENDFGYVPAVWDRWVEEAKAPAIESVRDFYRTAQAAGVEVFFITGRPQRAKESTARNLRALDCGVYAELICKPDGAKGTSAAFKSAARTRLAQEGWRIIANLGDQQSDLAGGFAERAFKLPNPFYLTE